MNVLEIALNIALAAITVSMLLCGWRLLRGPTAPDRVLALDTLYLSLVALVVLLGLAANARAVAEMANDPRVRAALAALAAPSPSRPP